MTNTDSQGRRLLLRRIERYLRQSGMAASRFGRITARDPRFVADVRGGRRPRRAMVVKVMAWLDRHEPRRRR